MASEAYCGRKHVRHSLVVQFESSAARDAFKSRLELIRSLLTPAEQPLLDNNSVMSAMFDLVERVVPAPLAGSERSTWQTFNRNGGSFPSQLFAFVMNFSCNWKYFNTLQVSSLVTPHQMMRLASFVRGAAWVTFWSDWRLHALVVCTTTHGV